MDQFFFHHISQPTLTRTKLSFDNEPCLFVLEISWEALSEIPVASSFGLKPSKPLVLMFCLLLTDVSEPGGLIEDVDSVAKEVVSILPFSEGWVPYLRLPCGSYNQHSFHLVLGYLF